VKPAFLHPFAPPAREEFLNIVRGDGAIVFDDQGNRYVDALASLWYCQIGHGRAEMVDAVATQMNVLENYNCFDIFTNEPADRFCDEVAALAPIPGARVFLTNSGSEAVDSAIKLVRQAMTRRGEPERHLVVTRHHAYHGVTYGGMSAQGLPPNKEGFGPLLEGVFQAAHDDITEIEALFREQGDRIAAVIAEPVIGAGGVRPPEPGYLHGLRKLCDEYGALLVLDEVICAFGRLGRWWGAEHYGVVPDAMTFAKGCTSGYLPLGGVVVGQAILDPLEADESFVLRHGHTYSGHPTCCVAGLENIRILRDEGLLDRAVDIGERLGSGLRAIADEGLVSEARGDVAIWAVEMNEGVSALAVRDAMRARGVLPRPLGDTAVAFCPPLVIEDDDLDLCLSALAESLRDLA
jgi:adenosylmethionine-8-amino-7-oxononanoate aminotransferase